MIELCKREKSFGMVQTSWHRPVTCKPIFSLSGALQWHGVDYTDEAVDAFVKDMETIERG